MEINRTGFPPKASTDDAISYFLPAKNVHYLAAVKGPSVGYFTHGPERAKKFATRFDACLAMNEAHAQRVRDAGGKRVRVIRPGTEPPARDIVFGVCARIVEGRNVKPRKGVNLVDEAVRAGYTFRACSPNHPRAWPCPVSHGSDDRDAFYASIDFLVVTSIEEGGPMPVVEAIARGVPVIAPDVGWSWEFPVIRYDVGSWPSLRSVLEGLTRPPSWKAWADEHRQIFEGIEQRSMTIGI